MNKARAIQKFHDAVYDATQVLEDLAKAGRLENEGKIATVEDVGKLRAEMANGAAELIDDHWISFDKPKASDDDDDDDEDNV